MPESTKPEGRPQGRSRTHTSDDGQVLALDNPIDKDYLCSKICMCNAGTKLKDRLGRELKQRCTTVSIWNDEEINQLVWRYKAEVGYSMKTNPPAPLMSREQPNRASRFPLGRATADGLLKRKFEGRPQRGLLRIPDCIILKVTGEELAAMRAAGHIDWKRLIPVQVNIETVLEIKFEGDSLTRGQYLDYATIAGDRKKFRLLKSVDCDCCRRREQPATEPVRSPVTTPMMQESAEERRWYQLTKPSPKPIPAPQPVKPTYGPVAPQGSGPSMADYLKGAAVVAGTIAVGAIIIAALPAEVVAASAAGLVALLVGTEAIAAPIKKDRQ